jgi:hypothetical protein
VECLERDLEELCKSLRTATRQTVKQVIMQDIELLVAKLGCLNAVVLNQTDKELAWSKVAVGKNRKRSPYIRRMDEKPVPIITNRYDLIKNAYCNSEVLSCRSVYHLEGKSNPKKVESANVKHKILIMGDSHVRGMASEVLQNLPEGFKVQGHIKPGANAAAILKTPTKEIEELTKNDVVVVWCGTGDAGRNDTRNCLHHIQSFVERYKNTCDGNKCAK